MVVPAKHQPCEYTTHTTHTTHPAERLSTGAGVRTRWMVRWWGGGDCRTPPPCSSVRGYTVLRGPVINDRSDTAHTLASVHMSNPAWRAAVTRSCIGGSCNTQDWPAVAKQADTLTAMLAGRLEVMIDARMAMMCLGHSDLRERWGRSTTTEHTRSQVTNPLLTLTPLHAAPRHSASTSARSRGNPPQTSPRRQGQARKHRRTPRCR